MEKESVGFVMYRDYMEYFSLLTNEEKAELIDAVFAYAFCNETVENMSRAVTLVFAFIKNRIDRDVDKYEKKCERNRKNAALGGRPAKKEETAPVKEESAPACAEEEKEEEEVEITPEISERFEEFFSAYPKQTDKEGALLEYARLSPDAELHRKIIMEVRSAKTYPNWQKEDGRYVPRASVWLKRREWEMSQKEKEKYRKTQPLTFDTDDFFAAALSRGEQFG